MTPADALSLAAKSTGRVSIRAGMTSSQLRDAEERFRLSFPPDFRELLAWGVPTGQGWPDWKRAIGSDHEAKRAAAAIEDRLAWPLNGMLFDIEHNVFWDNMWGKRPSDPHAANAIAAKAVSEAPKLIPVFSHRYLPAEPAESGNPVLSVYQMDIIVYGANLADYFEREFLKPALCCDVKSRPIRCWSRWSEVER